MARSIALLVSAAAAALAGLALIANSAAAVSYSCMDNYASDNPGLQAAINGGGTISVSGICRGNWEVRNDVTLQAGSPGATLNGNTTGSVLTVDGPVTVWINGLTITNGLAEGFPYEGQGGGIRSLGSATVNLVGSTVSGNTACDGGGIAALNSTVSLTASSVSKNRAVSVDVNCVARGGGILAFLTSINVANSNVSDNTASHLAGGIWADFSTVSLADTSVSGNSAGLRGGGIGVSDTSLQASDSTITGNSTSLVGGSPPYRISGGGLDALFSDVTLTRTRVTGDATFGDGGGIHFASGSFPRVPTSRTLESEPRVRSTATVVQSPFTLSLVDSRIDHNQALVGAGGGIANLASGGADSAVELSGTTVSFNSAPGHFMDGRSGGGGIANLAYEGDTASVTSVGSSLVGNLSRAVGGGIANFDLGGSALVTLEQTNVSSARDVLNSTNQALYGGGVFNTGANANVTLQGGTNIQHNKAFVNGGGVYNDCSASLTIQGGLVFLNTPDNVFTNLGPCLIN